MLYPTTIIPFSTAVGYQFMANSTVSVIPIDVPTGGSVRFIVTQSVPTEDFSLRASITTQPAGSPMRPDLLWPVRRVADVVIALYDAASATPVGDLLVAVAPGQYYLNVQNLVNTENCFQFALAGDGV